MNPEDQKIILEEGRTISVRIRSQAIREFCKNADIPRSVEALNLPDDVKVFRMTEAVKTTHR